MLLQRPFLGSRSASRSGAVRSLAALLFLIATSAGAEGPRGAPLAPRQARPQAAKGSAHAPVKPPRPRSAPPAVPKGYANNVRAWHTPAPGRSAPLDVHDRPQLVLHALNTGERVELVAASDRGGFSASDLDRAATLLRDPRTGNEHPVEPRLLDAIYRVARTFSAQEIRVISGYRTPKPGGHSNHGRGRAMDIVVPGASDEDVAKFARGAGFAGVGIYPVSGFVHVDVRERSYFWVDTSGPGRKSRLRGVLADLASRADAAALARGEKPILPFSLGVDVEAALRAQNPGLAEPVAHEEDEDVEPGGG